MNVLKLLILCSLLCLWIKDCSRAQYWENQYDEVQDNYEAISKENEELKASLTQDTLINKTRYPTY